MDCSPPGSSFSGDSQARVLEWVAITFSRRYSWPRDWTQVSCVAGRFFTVWAIGKSRKGLNDLDLEPDILEHEVKWALGSTERSEVKVKAYQLCQTLHSHGLYSAWNSPGQNTGVGSLSLLQGIFQIQGSNPGLLHCRRILYQLSHKGSLRILEWVAYSFSSGSSQPRNLTWVSCIVGGFFTNWAMREAPKWSESESHSAMSNSLISHWLYIPWNSLGQNIGMDSLCPFHWIFLTQESNWSLLHCRWIL